MPTNATPWVRVRVHGEDGHYDGEPIAWLEDGLVVNVVGDEQVFEGTNAFPRRAIASDDPPPHSPLRGLPVAGWDLRTRALSASTFRDVLTRHPPDRLLLLEELGDPEATWVGFARVEDARLVLDEIGPDGRPAGKERYPIDQLARVAWGGGYLHALEEHLRPGTRAVDAFAAAARRFAEAVQGGRGPATLQRVLTELHLRALDLPDWDGDALVGEAWPQPSGLPDRDLFDPCTTEPGEPVANTLADDLSDVWRDVTEGLSLYDAGHRGSACVHWRLGHGSHWGEHAVGALRALHRANG